MSSPSMQRLFCARPWSRPPASPLAGEQDRVDLALGDSCIRSVDDDDGDELEFEHDDGEETRSTDFDEIDALLARTSRSTNDIQIAAANRDDSGFVYDEDWDEESRLSEWRERMKESENLPPLMAAGLALEAWEMIEPLQHRAWLGSLLAAALLRARGKTRHHLVAMHAGFRHALYRHSRRHDLVKKLTVFAQAIETMAKLDSKELDRLTLVRELLLRKSVGRRSNSKLPRLVDLCLQSPIISVPLAAEKLRVSQQAVTIMIEELAPNLRELTGRGRYRAWAIL